MELCLGRVDEGRTEMQGKVGGMAQCVKILTVKSNDLSLIPGKRIPSHPLTPTGVLLLVYSTHYQIKVGNVKTVQHYQQVSGQPKLPGALSQKQNCWVLFIPVLWRQRQMAFCEFKVYTVSSRRIGAVYHPSSTATKTKTNKQATKTKTRNKDQCHIHLHRDFESSLGYIKLVKKKCYTTLNMPDLIWPLNLSRVVLGWEIAWDAQCYRLKTTDNNNSNRAGRKPQGLRARSSCRRLQLSSQYPH